MSDRNVFIYWEGDEPPLISILRELIYKFSNNEKNYKVIFLNDKNIEQFIDLEPHYWKLAVNHKSDFIRAKVIFKYGGIWLDSDTLVMSDLGKLFEILENKEGFLIKENNKIICTGVFGARKSSEFLKEWIGRTEVAIKKDNLLWSEIGPFMVDSIFRSTELCKNFIVFNGLDTMYPVNWDQCPKEFLLNNNINKIKKDFQPLIILVNSVYRQTSKMSKKQIIYMNNNLGFLLREAIQK